MKLICHFPLGGCFGFWGYDLKKFHRAKTLPRRAVNDLELPDCAVGFYDSLVVFDHQLGKVLFNRFSRPERRRLRAMKKKAQSQLEFWNSIILKTDLPQRRRDAETEIFFSRASAPLRLKTNSTFFFRATNLFTKVERAQKYIRAGDIYQVNLSHRLEVESENFQLGFFPEIKRRPPLLHFSRISGL